jgi:hypothetical protein
VLVSDAAVFLTKICSSFCCSRQPEVSSWTKECLLYTLLSEKNRADPGMPDQ